MSEVKNIAELIAQQAQQLAPALVADAALPSVTDLEDAEFAIERVVTQDPSGTSKRIWATAFAVLTAVLAVPEVQALLGPWAPVVTAVLSAGLAAWSKAADPRPAR